MLFQKPAHCRTAAFCVGGGSRQWRDDVCPPAGACGRASPPTRFGLHVLSYWKIPCFHLPGTRWMPRC
jgi:hypothetical protein